ncbi:MAG: histidinol dehydrogenase, partial [Gammaproteobacteria bacterium]|nr:histidinol dehydrogenase [Gammaproteobacteria bacterium]
AEHDADAQAILVSPDAACLDRVQAEIAGLIDTLPRAEVIRLSLQERGALIEVGDLAQACEIANRVAPEHLQLAVRDPEALLPAIRHAGAIFLGAHAAEVFGDYVAGPSHVLPTFGTARYASPLSVPDFLKRSSIIGGGQSSVQSLARIAANIADAEGLAAHGLAARARLDGYDDNRSS